MFLNCDSIEDDAINILSRSSPLVDTLEHIELIAMDRLSCTMVPHLQSFRYIDSTSGVSCSITPFKRTASFYQRLLFISTAFCRKITWLLEG